VDDRNSVLGTSEQVTEQSNGGAPSQVPSSNSNSNSMGGNESVDYGQDEAPTPLISNRNEEQERISKVGHVQSTIHKYFNILCNRTFCII
jgi:hypothetical protein